MKPGKSNLAKLKLSIEEDIVSLLGKYPETILKSSNSRGEQNSKLSKVFVTAFSFILWFNKVCIR